MCWQSAYRGRPIERMERTEERKLDEPLLLDLALDQIEVISE